MNMATNPTTDMFTFHDPSSSSFFAESDPTLGLSDEVFPLIIAEQNYLNYRPDHHKQPGHYELNNNILLDPDDDDPLSDPVIWAFCNDVPGNSLAGQGCSSSHTGGANNNYDNFSNFDDDTVFGDNDNIPIMPLSVYFSVPRTQYNCTCCQILREITHTNGMNVKRLEIHGIFGVITHAVLGIYGFDSSFQDQGIQMFDFHNESTQMVKKFLVQYFEACKREGYNTLQDPLSTFYEALCVGLNEPDNPDDFLQLSPKNITGYFPNSQQEQMEQTGSGSNRVGFMKIPLSMQRERTRNLRLRDFIDHFDLPIEDAARKMNICPTVMKKICRKNGVPRWPYRKIKSIKRKITKKTKIVDASDDQQESARALEDIQKHHEELAEIHESFNK